jgi:hypothetical protein
MLKTGCHLRWHCPKLTIPILMTTSGSNVELGRSEAGLAEVHKVAVPDLEAVHSTVQSLPDTRACKAQEFHICELQMLHDEVDHRGQSLCALSTSPGTCCHHLVRCRAGRAEI